MSRQDAHVAADDVNDHSNRSAFYREAVALWLRRATDDQIEQNLKAITDYEACVYGDGCERKKQGGYCYHSEPRRPAWEASYVSVDPHPNIQDATYKSGYNQGEPLSRWDRNELHQKNVSNALQLLKRKGVVTKASDWGHMWCLPDGVEAYTEQRDHYRTVQGEASRQAEIEREKRMAVERVQHDADLDDLLETIATMRHRWTTAALRSFVSSAKRYLPNEWHLLPEEKTEDDEEIEDETDDGDDWIDVSGDLEGGE